jgi:hypothetical protein
MSKRTPHVEALLRALRERLRLMRVSQEGAGRGGITYKLIEEDASKLEWEIAAIEELRAERDELLKAAKPKEAS